MKEKDFFKVTLRLVNIVWIYAKNDFITYWVVELLNGIKLQKQMLTKDNVSRKEYIMSCNNCYTRITSFENLFCGYWYHALTSSPTNRWTQFNSATFHYACAQAGVCNLAMVFTHKIQTEKYTKGSSRTPEIWHSRACIRCHAHIRIQQDF